MEEKLYRLEFKASSKERQMPIIIFVLSHMSPSNLRHFMNAYWIDFLNDNMENYFSFRAYLLERKYKILEPIEFTIE